MRKIDNIIQMVAAGVKQDIIDAVLDEYDWIDYEKDFGASTVNVRIREVRTLVGLVDDVEVFITHANEKHSSPRLERAITEALPSWFTIKNEVLTTTY